MPQRSSQGSGFESGADSDGHGPGGLMKFLVTGGAGFIGSALVRHLLMATEHSVVHVDKLTYAANLDSLAAVSASPRYAFEWIDIADRAAMESVFSRHQPDVVMHLAAESHVDRSIAGPDLFIHTNVVGTATLLEVARQYWQGLQPPRREAFRLLHVSTDEVYGDLELDAAPFTESHPYKPSSPYAASKASSDHLVRAWHRTYGLPVLVSNCSNNYGPCQFPEKLIPLMILNALHGRALPVYGDGQQIRDWLYVEDHVRALLRVVEAGRVGATYNIGGHNERTNLEVVRAVCSLLDELVCERPDQLQSFHELITSVTDRPGHDRRYAVDAKRMAEELGWTPQETFESGLRRTVQWYLANPHWWRRVLDGAYRQTTAERIAS